MGFLTRLLAGLTAAAALGAGLTGTANAVGVTGATGTTKSVVKLADVLDNLCDVATYPAAERAKHKRKTIARAKHALELVREDDPPAIHRAAAAVKRLLKSA